MTLGFSNLGHWFILLGVSLSFVHEMARDSLTRRWSGSSWFSLSRSLSLGLSSFMELFSFLAHLVVLDHSVDGSSSGSSTRGALSLRCSEFAEDGFGEFRDLGIVETMRVFFFFFVLIGLTNWVGIGLIGFWVMLFSF